QPQVVADRTGQHRRLLLDVPEIPAQLLARQVPYVDPADPYRPGAHLVEALHEREDRRLARPGRPDQRGPGPVRDGEAHLAQHRLAVRVRERHPVQLDRDAAPADPGTGYRTVGGLLGR